MLVGLYQSEIKDTLLHISVKLPPPPPKKKKPHTPRLSAFPPKNGTT